MNAVRSFIIGVALTSLLLGAGAAGAQQIVGLPGSPSATTTMQGSQTSEPPPKLSDTGSTYKLTWTINRITLTVDRPKPTPEDDKRLSQSVRDKKVSD